MKRTILLLAATLILLPGCHRPKLDPALASYIDSVMNATYGPDQPGAVILVARDGEPVFRKAYGLASLELKVPIRPENVFAIASMTKQFTAVCVLELVQEGKLSLQDDIRKYLPLYNTHGRVITVEHLLAHTSGIPNITSHPDFYAREIVEPTREELINCAAEDSLLFEPGTDWSYNDVGYILAAFIVERVSGVPFRDYMRENIFEPAGMKSTTFGTRERVLPLLVPAYTPGEGDSFRPEERYGWAWRIGMGEIITTADDMLRWDEALSTEKLVKKDLLEKAWSSSVLANGQKTNYGYGWWVSQPEGTPVIMHVGAVGGFRSFSFRVPSQHLFVVFLSNNGRVGYAGPLRTLLPRLAGLTQDMPAVRRLPPEELKEYTGLYEILHYGSANVRDVTRERLYWSIALRDTVLVSQRPGRGTTPLFNVGRDLFTVKDGGSYFHFRRDDAGKIDAMELSYEPIAYGPTQISPRTDLPLPKERVRTSLDEKTLTPLAGRYNFGGEHTARVRVDGGRITMDGVGELLPESETRWFAKDADVTVEFLKSPKGVVTGLLLDRAWKSKARRVE